MSATVLRADARNLPLPDASVDLIVTSPPYFGLRSYTDGGAHYAGQIGSESTPQEWLEALWACTAEWVRVLKPEGSLFVNLGDSYNSGPSGRRVSSGLGGTPQAARGSVAGLGARVGAVCSDGSRASARAAPKSLLGLPWRYAIGCMDRLGLILRAEIIWAKPNGLPESVTDRVRRAHEQVFHFTRLPRYYAAVDEIREPHAPAPRGKHDPGSWNGGKVAHVGNGHAGVVGARPDPNPLGKLPGSVWDIPSQPLVVPASLGVDHFAAFPMELPRRCILGWSPPGVCTACHQGRRPVVERASMRRHNNGRHGPTGLAPDNTHGLNHSTLDIVPDYRITGYTCACEEEVMPHAPDENYDLRPARHVRRPPSGGLPPTNVPGPATHPVTAGNPTGPGTRPAVVLDPFGGTGTTALVASVLGRHGITTDLSADYCRLAAWRTTDPGERARAMQVPKPPPAPEGMDALFEMTP